MPAGPFARKMLRRPSSSATTSTAGSTEARRARHRRHDDGDLGHPRDDGGRPDLDEHRRERALPARDVQPDARDRRRALAELEAGLELDPPVRALEHALVVAPDVVDALADRPDDSSDISARARSTSSGVTRSASLATSQPSNSRSARTIASSPCSRTSSMIRALPRGARGRRCDRSGAPSRWLRALASSAAQCRTRSGPSGTLGTPASIDRDERARHVCGLLRGEVRDEARDLHRASEATRRDPLQDLRQGVLVGEDGSVMRVGT